MVLANEQILDLVAVAAGAAQTDHVPGVDPGGFAGGEQQRADDDLAVGVAPGRAVGLDDAGMPAQPGGVSAATDEGPTSGQPIAVALDSGLRLGTRTPGQHGLQIAAPDLPRDLGVQKSGRHGAAVPLAKAPGGTRVVLRHFLDHLEEGRRVGLEAAEGARQEQTEQAFPVQRGLKRRAQAQPPLGCLGLGLDGRSDASDPGETVLAGIGPARHDRCLQRRILPHRGATIEGHRAVRFKTVAASALRGSPRRPGAVPAPRCQAAAAGSLRKSGLLLAVSCSTPPPERSG